MEGTNGNIAKILVVGIGGGGGNAVNAMVNENIQEVEFLAMNTDKQALSTVRAKRLAIGEKLTKGLGAGANPEIGRQAAEESRATIQQMLEGADLVFIAAGMGGGTGTGAAPVVAQIARELGILTIAVVTKPFNFEGTRRMKYAEMGIDNLKGNVDALVIVQNEKLNRDKNFSIKDAFTKADEILMQGIRGVTEIVVQNVLFGVGFDEEMKDEVRVTLIATGFSGGNDGKAAFFSSEAATQVAADNVKRRAEATAGPATVNPVDMLSQGGATRPAPQPSAFTAQKPVNAPISGTVSVDEDKNIPPFLRKMKG